MTTIKVGDTVEALCDCTVYYHKGDKGVVTEFTLGGYVVQFDTVRYGDGNWFCSNVKLISSCPTLPVRNRVIAKIKQLDMKYQQHMKEKNQCA